MARFTWALSFTTKTGMDINEAVELGFDVASYAPINQHQDKVLEQMQHGVSLHEAFSETHGFPHEFLLYLHTGEQSGELPETLARLSDEYTDQTRVHMKILSVMCYFAVFIVMVVVMASLTSMPVFVVKLKAQVKRAMAKLRIALPNRGI
jgi:type II secretory pathway component PulF